MNLILQKLGFSGGSSLTAALILPALIVSFILGYIIAFVYRRTEIGFSYERSFNFTIVLLTIITTVIMMIIGANIALSLGLIGSLSIIRFRAVIKDSKDMAYLLWAIATGLSIGSGSYLMAFISVPFIGVIIFYLARIDFSGVSNTDYVMVMHSSVNPGNDNLDGVAKILDNSKIKWSIRSSMIDKSNSLKETTYSISAKGIKGKKIEDLLESINRLEHMKKVSLLSPETNLFA